MAKQNQEGGERSRADKTKKTAARAKEAAERSARKAGESAEEALDTAGTKAEKAARETGGRALDRAAEVGEKAREAASEVRKKLPEVREKMGHAAGEAGKGLRSAGTAIGRALERTARASGKLAGVLNVKAEKAAENRKMRSLFRKIGEKHYAVRREGKTGAEAEIDSLLDQVETAKKEMSRLESKEKSIRSRPV